MILDFLIFYLEEFSYLAVFVFSSISHIVPIPEEAILIASGYAASLGIGRVSKFIFAAFFGILFADNFAYWIGRKKGEQILGFFSTVFYITQDKINKSRDFLQKHAWASVFLARFLAGFRFFTPYLAGSLGIHYLTFLIFNTLGALIWIPAVILLSYGLSGAFDLYQDFTFLKHAVLISAIIVAGFWVGWQELWKN